MKATGERGGFSEENRQLQIPPLRCGMTTKWDEQLHSDSNNRSRSSRFAEG